MREYCNFGYARRYCDRFPDDSGPDAVRFAVSRDRDGVIDIVYVLEKDHCPFAQGALAYELSRRAFRAPHANPILNRQAEAYMESYLRRKDAHKNERTGNRS